MAGLIEHPDTLPGLFCLTKILGRIVELLRTLRVAGIAGRTYPTELDKHDSKQQRQ